MKTQELKRQLEEIHSLLKQKDQQPLNFVEAAKYLSISQSTLYKLSYQRKIPSHKPSGKLLYFFKHELDEWISKGSDECKVMSDELQGMKRKKREGRRERKNNTEDEDEPDG